MEWAAAGARPLRSPRNLTACQSRLLDVLAEVGTVLLFFSAMPAARPLTRHFLRIPLRPTARSPIRGIA